MAIRAAAIRAIVLRDKAAIRAAAIRAIVLRAPAIRAAVRKDRAASAARVRRDRAASAARVRRDRAASAVRVRRDRAASAVRVRRVRAVFPAGREPMVSAAPRIPILSVPKKTTVMDQRARPEAALAVP